MEVRCIPGKHSLPGGVIFNREGAFLSIWFGDFSITAALDQSQIAALGQAMASPEGGPDCVCAPTSFCVEKFDVAN